MTWYEHSPALVMMSIIKPAAIFGSRRNAGEQHITIPYPDPIKIGTLNAILRSVAEHAGLNRKELIEQLFG